MLDIKRLRDDRDGVVAALDRRGDSFGETIDRALALDARRRDALTEVNDLKARRNAVSREVGTRKRAGEDADDLIAEMREVGDAIDALDAAAKEAETSLHDLLLHIPNTPLDEVPAGGEEANRVVGDGGADPAFDFTPKPHWELGEDLGILDLPGGARVSGSGFPVLRGAGARLQRGLINFFLDRHVERNGYTEVRIPYLVHRSAMTGTGQLPKFAEDSYHIERDDLWLIPTAEVPVTNLEAESLLETDRIPLHLTACSPCFRREAGAAGKDTRGLLRVHQFDKVELVRYERPEESRAALDDLTRQAEELLTDLGLRWRRVLLAGGDLGFSSALTFDLEVWAPGVESWLEVSSCSVFTDYQARRAGLRFRPAPGEKPEYVHTLNGSALALPRTVAALLETHQEADGSVRIPEVLQPWVGMDRIAVAS